jgi:hypothetical protein
MTRKTDTLRELLKGAPPPPFVLGGVTMVGVPDWIAEGEAFQVDNGDRVEALTCTAIDRERGLVTFDHPIGVPLPRFAVVPSFCLRTHPVVTRYLKRTR